MAAKTTYEHCTFPGGYSPYETRGDCTYNARAADSAVRFFAKELRHVKGELAGKPFVLGTWEANIIGSAFGWKRPDGTRRYRYVYVEIPRKAGKSMIGFGVALLLLYVDGEPGAEIYSVAGDTDQANIVFDMAKQNVLANKTLADRSKPYLKSIIVYDPRTGLPCGSYKVLSSEAAGKHGKSPSGIIFDELHVQPNDLLWEALRSGVGARRQPLTMTLTTAGYDRHSLCWAQHQLACNVRDGILPNDGILPVIYAADPTDDWTDPVVWRKAQPNLGVSVPESFYADECKMAQQSPSYENTFKRLYLNIWTEQAERWLPMDTWDSAASQETGDLTGESCWAGLDLSATTDLTALVLAFHAGEQVAVLPFFWIPEDRARTAEQRDRVPYRRWHEEGFLRFTPGDTVRADFIRRDINELREKYQIEELSVDPWNATQLVTQLQDDGLNVVMFRQGYGSMSGPAKEFEKLVLAKNLIHGGHPVLRWNASNVAITSDASGNIKPAKDKSTGRIDGIVAAVMAVGRALTADISAGWSREDGVLL